MRLRYAPAIETVHDRRVGAWLWRIDKTWEAGMKLNHKSLAAGVALAGAAFAACGAQATVLYSTGFEPTTFSPGAIAGQGGWKVFSASGQPSLAQVETSVVKSGVQAVSVDGSASGQTGPYYEYTPLTAGKIIVSADIMLSAGTSTDSWQLGVTGPGLSQFAGGIDITGNTINAISGAFSSIGTFTTGVWHNVAIDLNYTSQTFDIKLDGATLASGLAFCGTNGGCTGAFIPHFGDVIFDTFGHSSNFGYLDNVAISTPTVPEPATWGLMLMGFAGLGGAIRSARRKAASRLVGAVG
jgi:hypothetical protein